MKKYFIKKVAKREGNRKVGRLPASNIDEEVEKSEDNHIFWLVLVFSLLGCYKVAQRKKL